jgi:hypothetical protein
VSLGRILFFVLQFLFHEIFDRAVKYIRYSSALMKLRHTLIETIKQVELMDFLMGCDLVNICAKTGRVTSEKSVNEN